jgi:hypothetical protein
MEPERAGLPHIASRLDLKGTPMEDWKLELASGQARIED